MVAVSVREGSRRVVVWAVCGVAAAVLAACGGGGSSDSEKDDVLTILHINDHHSTLASKTATLQLPVDGIYDLADVGQAAAASLQPARKGKVLLRV